MSFSFGGEGLNGPNPFPKFSFGGNATPVPGTSLASAPAKTTFLKGTQDPDVTIIVGGEEYREYGQSLSCWSGYFDRALSSGMKEEQTRRFEFPDRDPKEWEWIVSLMSPMAKDKVTMEKLPIALNWFDFLCSNLGLQACDNVLCEHLLHSARFPIAPAIPLGNAYPRKKPRRSSPSAMDAAEERAKKAAVAQLFLTMTHLPTIVTYNLKNSKAVGFKTVRVALVHQVIVFSKDNLKTIASLVKDNIECRSQFLGPLKTHLPSSISEDQAEVLIANDVLHEMIFLEIEKAKTQEEHQSATKRMVKIVGQASIGIKQALRDDVFWGQVVPDPGDNWRA